MDCSVECWLATAFSPLQQQHHLKDGCVLSETSVEEFPLWEEMAVQEEGSFRSPLEIVRVRL